MWGGVIRKYYFDHNVVEGTWRQESVSDPGVSNGKEENKLFPADMRNILNLGEYKIWHMSG